MVDCELDRDFGIRVVASCGSGFRLTGELMAVEAAEEKTVRLVLDDEKEEGTEIPRGFTGRRPGTGRGADARRKGRCLSGPNEKFGSSEGTCMTEYSG